MSGNRAVTLWPDDEKTSWRCTAKKSWNSTWRTSGKSCAAVLSAVFITEGVLPGKLRVPRRAAALRRMLVSQDKTTTDPMAVVDWINMFALAVNEENAAGGRVVVAAS
ncbi:L-serine ammonia-lyase, iron-sulfur-dependent, subunit alpha [Escherichia coli]